MNSGVTIYCTTVGGLEKVIYYYFETNGIETCLNPSGTVIGPGTSEQSITVPSDLATHGSHKVRIELYQRINGKADTTSAATPIEMIQKTKKQLFGWAIISLNIINMIL